MTTNITQEDREGAALILNEMSNLLGHDGIGQVADLIRDGEYDEHEAVQAFARHRIAAEAKERERIVTWLREMFLGNPVTNLAADAIERGDHREANNATGE